VKSGGGADNHNRIAFKDKVMISGKKISRK
jgi:hypothetical protein